MFFGLFDSEEKKMRTHATNWLELADKIFNYRRDILPAPLLAELQTNRAAVRTSLRGKDDAAKLKLKIEALEATLRRTGGTHYPKSTLTENVEFFLVAAIIILGIRTYFVQPFKIPTNSMWPSYNGLTAEIFDSREAEPKAAERAFRLVTKGARPRTIDAPMDGEVLIPLYGDEHYVKLPPTEVAGRNWLIFPARHKKFTLLVGNKPVFVTVPGDFDFEWAVRDAFFPQDRQSREPGPVDLARHLKAQREVLEDPRNPGIRFLRTGKFVKTGERVMSFDILTGDQLFVDRISYHFVRPKVGDGFVFRTGNIPDMKGDQYYIKRLAGTPGDVLEIRNPVLYRNGEPITGSSAFEANAKLEGRYVGYRAMGILEPGKRYTVPENAYIALGDNSANSQDSRYWETVPAKDVVGRPLWIYFPFTTHWGSPP